MRRLQTRLAAVAEVFGSETVVRELARPAFDVFRKTGELPEDQHVAHEVVQRVLRGYDSLPNTGHSALDRQRAFRIAVNTPDRPPDPIFDSLFDEAVWAPDPMRWAAREALKELSALGLDVTKPVFAGRKIDGPWRGSVGLTMLGFPDILYTPPHEDRAARMFAYFARVREQVAHDDQAWFEALRDARPGSQHVWHALTQARLHGILDAVKTTEREKAELRAALERVQEIVATVLDGQPKHTRAAAASRTRKTGMTTARPRRSRRGPRSPSLYGLTI